MVKLTESQREVIKEAYDKYLNYMSLDENKEKIDFFMDKLKEFNDNLNNYKSEDGIEKIIEFGITLDANIFAAAGMGIIFKSGYYEYLSRQDVREKLIKMIELKNESNEEQKYQSLLEYDIRQYLDSVTLNNNKPRLLIGRLVLMMFPELFTSVPYEAKLNKICKKLEIQYDKNTPYLAKQRMVRELTDAYLKENNLYNVVIDNTKVSLAWWIVG